MKIEMFTIIVLVIISSAAVSATTFNLISPTGRETINFDQTTIFNRDISVSQDNISVDIYKKDNKIIKNTILYLCKDRNPSSCIDVVNPIKYLGGIKSTFLKSDVMSNIGYMLFFIEIETSDKQTIWISDLALIEGNTVSYLDSYEVDVDLNTNLDDAKSTLLKTGNLPMGFINSIQFKGKDVYQISGNPVTVSPRGEKYLNFTYNKVEKNVQRIDGFNFVFPIGNDVLSPVSLYNLEEFCGDAYCGLGESYNTCWLDCRCPVGQFPGNNGCTSDTIPMIIENNSEILKCISGGLLENDKCSMLPQDLELKVHLQNPPVDYRINSQYFYLGGHFVSGQSLCIPDQIPSKRDLGNGRFVFINNATDYTCSVPFIDIKKQEVGDLVYSIHFSLSYNSLNGTEVKEASGQTIVHIDDILPSNLLTLQEKLNEASKIPGWLKSALDTVKVVEAMSGVAAVGTCLCCALPFCSAGGSCGACVKFTGWTLIFESIRQVLSYANAQCVGVYQPQVFGVPVGDASEIHGGSGRDAASSVSSACREIKRNQDLIRQEVGLAKEKQQVELSGALQHLVWIYGESSGYSPKAVCGNENVQIWYSLDSFRCDKDLWFNINSNERPFCDQNQVFTTATPLGYCDFINTSDYIWNVTDTTGNIAKQYNTTGYNMLYNGSAQNLFAGQNNLNITISCSSDAYGDITDTLKIAEYDSNCPVASASTINIFNPNIVNNPNISVI